MCACVFLQSSLYPGKIDLAQSHSNPVATCPLEGTQQRQAVQYTSLGISSLIPGMHCLESSGPHKGQQSKHCYSIQLLQ